MRSTWSLSLNYGTYYSPAITLCTSGARVGIREVSSRYERVVCKRGRLSRRSQPGVSTKPYRGLDHPHKANFRGTAPIKLQSGLISSSRAEGRKRHEKMFGLDPSLKPSNEAPNFKAALAT